MSSFTTYKIKVGNISKQMLCDAVTRYAKLKGLTVVQAIQDYYGARHSCHIGLTGQGLRYGIGFSLDGQGNMTVQGDSWGWGSTAWNEIQRDVQNHVVAQKIAVNTRAQHPNARINIKQVEKVVQLEVQW